MLNSIDIDINIPSNEYTIFSIAETNNTSTEVNSSILPIKECFKSAKYGNKPSIEFHKHLEIKNMQENFNKAIFHHKVHHYHYCHE